MCVFLLCFCVVVLFFCLVWFGFWKVTSDVGPFGPHNNLTLPFVFGLCFFVFFVLVVVVVVWVATDKPDNQPKTYRQNSLFSKGLGHFGGEVWQIDKPINKQEIQPYFILICFSSCPYLSLSFFCLSSLLSLYFSCSPSLLSFA